ncbi:BnaC09g29700D [Brassica napus]|uniref:(rape) hypothetical protein n=1 Tax=Brassica napus TaxID=3708 RepID=A0A078HFR4_BRANA|nr:unnamed protein product [Brassica napus]CDY35648.1 BnaC09g29700D [Brassica napus]
MSGEWISPPTILRVYFVCIGRELKICTISGCYLTLRLPFSLRPHSFVTGGFICCLKRPTWRSGFLGLLYFGKSLCSSGALPTAIWSFNRGRCRAVCRRSHPVRFSRTGTEQWSGIIRCCA